MLTIQLTDNKIDPRDIPKVRGYIASKFPQYIELHNHADKDKYIYSYPLVQYKVIDGVATFIAVNEVVKTLMEVIYEVEEIDIKDRIITIMEKGYKVSKAELSDCQEMINYKFVSPWMALSQKNYNSYINADEAGKQELLKRILIGNIISLSKYLNYTIQNRLQVDVDLKEYNINFKNQSMTAFKGSFKVNFKIPDYLGLGKSVSRGFGTIIKVK